MLLCFVMKTTSGSGPDKKRTYVRHYYGLVVLFFQLSTYHVGTAWEISYLRIYPLLVPYDLFKNIDCLSYSEFPENVKVKDVCKSQRALDHIKTTINKINKEKGKLLNCKKELYGDNLEPKKWASNEIAFVQAMTAQTGEMLKESEEIANDIEHINNQLRKRFDAASVNDYEKKRKMKRAKN